MDIIAKNISSTISPYVSMSSRARAKTSTPAATISGVGVGEGPFESATSGMPRHNTDARGMDFPCIWLPCYPPTMPRWLQFALHVTACVGFALAVWAII